MISQWGHAMGREPVPLTRSWAQKTPGIATCLPLHAATTGGLLQTLVTTSRCGQDKSRSASSRPQVSLQVRWPTRPDAPKCAGLAQLLS